jgi:hypothetical protein
VCALNSYEVKSLLIIDLKKKFKWYQIKPYELLNLELSCKLPYLCIHEYLWFYLNLRFLVSYFDIYQVFIMKASVFLFQEFSIIWYKSKLSFNHSKHCWRFQMHQLYVCSPKKHRDKPALNPCVFQICVMTLNVNEMAKIPKSDQSQNTRRN